MIVLVLVTLLLAAWVLRGRAKRRRQLAGIEATRPVFSSAPPVARLSNLKGERL
jgi:hypothetical protein